MDHFDVNALRCQEATEQGLLLDLRESDTKTLSADRIVPPTRRCRTMATWQAGKRTQSAREVLASRGVGHEKTRRRDSGTSGCDFENVDSFKQVKSQKRHGRLSADALSRQARKTKRANASCSQRAWQWQQRSSSADESGQVK